jgi:hypothetical protein
LALTPLEAHTPVAVGVHRLALTIGKVSLGDQVLIGNSNALAVGVAGPGNKELAVAQGTLGQGDAGVVEMRSSEGSLFVEDTPSPLAFAMVLDRGRKAPDVDTVINRILGELDIEQRTVDTVRKTLPEAVGFLGGLAGSAALWLVDQLVEAISQALFGQHVLVADKVSLHYDDDSNTSRLRLLFASIPVFEDINVGEGYTLEDFGVHPDHLTLMWNKKGFPRRGTQASPHPYAIVDLVSHR